MKTKITNLIFLMLIVAAFVVGIILYPRLPNVIASHWNAAGQVNGYMGKFWGVFLMPVILLVMFVLYLIIPRVDPLKANIDSFRKHYNLFWVLFPVFLLYVYALQLGWNLGLRFNFSTAIVPVFALLWYFLGVIMSKAKRNWFFGIRTPWTLSNDIVWDKTHQLGGLLFKIAALISLLALFSPSMFVYVIIIPILLIAAITTIYSYLEFKKLK